MVGETGEGPGVGSVLNVPLPSGSGNGAYHAVFEEIVLPALRTFRPELIVVASGFDAAGLDPLGRMNVTAAGFRAMANQLVGIADEVCDGRLVMSHEGGYSPVYVPYCGLAVLEGLSGYETGVQDPFAFVFEDSPAMPLKPWEHEVITQSREIAELLGMIVS
jgi:acetoin utilization deacetylase AcuC-like enzyme